MDVLKGLAAIGVMLCHGMPHDFWLAEVSARPFNYGQAVPIFLVVLGMNGLRTARRARRPLFTLGYLARQFDRIVVPVAIAWAIAFVLAVLFASPAISELTLLGHLPLNGPGNYFIALLLQWILVFPLLAAAYTARPGTTIAVCFALAAAVELAAMQGAFDAEPYLFRACILRYLPAIALGMYLLEHRRGWPLWMYAGVLVSVWYLVAATLIPDDLPNRDFRFVTYAAPTAFYSVALVRLALDRLPESRLLAALGLASMHIFLAQIIWFELMPSGTWLQLAAAVSACCTIGYVAYRLLGDVTPATDRVRRPRRQPERAPAGSPGHRPLSRTGGSRGA
jgi:peptidoglycan/LPS O-acetylase OafA/YrhL